MIRYFLNSLWAHFRAGRSLFLLTVCGVALGVAAVLSIQIINRNALAAFEGSMYALSGDADLTVLGRAPTLPDSVFVDILSTPGVQSAWPLYRISVALADRERFFLEIIGVDFFAPVRIPWQGEFPDISQALSRPGWAAFTPALARQMGWVEGDTVQVYSGSRTAALTVGALVDFQRISPLASPKMAVMDIAQAQHLLGRKGHIHQIDLIASDDVETVRTRLQNRLGPSVQVVAPEQRTQQAEGLLSAFRLNLTALSLISLFVGLFLVYSSTQASLVRRRASFGLLRSIGATRAQVFGLIASEVVLLGVLGVLLGLPLGYWGAKANVEVVSAALTNLYLLEEIAALELPPRLFVSAALIGIGGALTGALMPALDMSRRDVRALLSSLTLHEKIGSLAPRLGLAGLAVILCAGAWYAWIGKAWQHAGFALALSILIALPLMAPRCVQLMTGWVRARGFGPGYSLKSLGAHLQTSAFAVAALCIAVSMLVGITLMVGSFRKTLDVWMRTTVQADIYISPASWRGQGDEAFLDEYIIDMLRAFPGVRALDRLRRFTAHTGQRQIALLGVDIGIPDGASRFEFLAGDPQTAYDQVRKGGAVLIGEPLARKLDLWPGDAVPIHAPGGIRAFPIAGVYYDYAAQGGAVLMDLQTLRAHWGNEPVNSVALYTDPGLDAEAIIDALRAHPATAPLEMRSNRRLRQEAMKVFDQTFAVTNLLQGISLAIAACGIALMLLVLAREQAPELALYRAIGATRTQIFGLFVGKGLGMGLMGLAMGMVGGLALAMILIFVINRAYFGWTIQVHWPWSALTFQTIAILCAALLSSLYPALKASRLSASALRREDA